METDELLMERAKRGDLEAFEVLVRRYEGPLYGFLCRLTRDSHLAEDLFQETFLRVFKNRTAFDPGRRFAPWLYGIGILAWKDHLRKEGRSKGREGWMSASEAVQGTDPANELERRQLQRIVQEGIKDLPEEDRMILVMRHYQGLSYEEIAEALHLPLGTVKSRLHYALARLRERLNRRKVLER